jgi:hypothetical protein
MAASDNRHWRSHRRRHPKGAPRGHEVLGDRPGAPDHRSAALPEEAVYSVTAGFGAECCVDRCVDEAPAKQVPRP